MTQSSQYKVSRSTSSNDSEHQLIQTPAANMRLWENEEPSETADKPLKTNDYDTLGYVIGGQVELVLGDETISLQAGDSYHVPKGVPHTYRVTETLTAVEVTVPGKES